MIPVGILVLLLLPATTLLIVQMWQAGNIAQMLAIRTMVVTGKTGQQLVWTSPPMLNLGTVRIVFTTRGCAYTAHRGYAYISAYCSAISIQTSLCEGQDSAILTAPPGFIHYSWTNGDTTQTIRVPSMEGATIQCTLTAVNGCTVTISNTLHYTQIQTGFTENLNCAQRPSSFEDTTWVSQNQVTAWRWFLETLLQGHQIHRI